jgi:hypothetical protein
MVRATDIEPGRFAGLLDPSGAAFYVLALNEEEHEHPHPHEG